MSVMFISAKTVEHYMMKLLMTYWSLEKMIELFEKVWQIESGADEVQLEKVYSFLRDNQFPVCELPDTYIEFLKESNGGDFTIGNREYQLFSVEETLQAYQSYNFSLYMP